MQAVIVVIAVYVLLAAMRPAGQPGPSQPSTATTSTAGTQITIPGFGSYTNIGGGLATRISLDPGFWSNLFGSGAAQPVPVSAAPAPADFGTQPLPAYSGDVSPYEWV